MKIVKLPRKRKKAYIKKHGRTDYVAASIIGQVLCEEKDCRKNRGFPEIGNPPMIKRKLNVLFYW